MAGQTPNIDQFETYFQKADVDRDGRISGNEAVAFLHASNLPRQVLAQDILPDAGEWLAALRLLIFYASLLHVDIYILPDAGEWLAAIRLLIFYASLLHVDIDILPDAGEWLAAIRLLIFYASLLHVDMYIWMYADQNQVGFLGRSEFYNFLKLVTVAQSKQELTPDLVKAALHGPASAKIPPPQINLTATIGLQSTAKACSSPAPLFGRPTSTQGIGVSAPHGFLTQQSQITRPPRPPPPTSRFQSQPGVLAKGIPGTGSMAASRHPYSFESPGGTTDGSQARLSSQVSNTSLVPSATQGVTSLMASPIIQTKAPEITGQPASSRLNDTALLSFNGGKEELKSLSATGNGFASDSQFDDVFSAIPTKPQINPAALAYPANNKTVSSTGNLTSSRDQPTVNTSAVSQPSPNEMKHFQSTGRRNQQAPVQKFSAPAGQSQSPWSRMTQFDVQKYRKVFVQVDTDKDGKITGEQARNLFLSWRLPQEVLKQVWDLSDQDNDSMLSLSEFCIALYLMERYREGRPLPTTLPNSVMFDETLLAICGQPSAVYANATWGTSPGFQQPVGVKNVQPITSAGVGKPPRPVPVPQNDEPIQQKAKVPVLEKHLLDQLSTEEQDSLNRKFEEAKDAERKVTQNGRSREAKKFDGVADLEKGISEAKQKIQFYHAYMQELILYKSRCDNRLNEISEKVVADKREAESLANKYEEKYKQVGDVASKLTIEEATFRDIQEKKMDIYSSIIKLEQDNTDGVQDRANQIQPALEELVKALNDRCKAYGLRGKPSSLVELPFGWQPGIEAAAADWDEVWDKFEDEGFTYVKELTLEVENVIAPPKPKSALIREETSLDAGGTVKSPSKADENPKLPFFEEKVYVNERLNTHNPEHAARSPPDSPAGSEMVVNPSKEIQDLQTRDINGNGSMQFDTQSEYGAESVRSGEERFDEPGWGSFDPHYDTVAAWDINSVDPKEVEQERHSEGSLFGPDDWSLNPIRTTGSKELDTSPTKRGPFFDSVLSTPKQGPFFDSVPSTPHYNFASSPHVDNLFMRNNSPFADSVPGTPTYNSNSSPRRFTQGLEEQYSLNSFSRFDSFNMHDNGPFGSRESLTVPMRSTRDSFDFDQVFHGQRELLTRFDSFRSMADSDYEFGLVPPGESLTRFDSTRGSESGHGFSPFNDSADPFGSNKPFGSSNEAQTPRTDSDDWKAF
ncbi:hypothetical protein OROGR_018009 [Orobanche gracilis]